MYVKNLNYNICYLGQCFGINEKVKFRNLHWKKGSQKRGIREEQHPDVLCHLSYSAEKEETVMPDEDRPSMETSIMAGILASILFLR